jgi:hypothetical protein
LKILIGGGVSFMFHLNRFSQELRERGVECKVVFDRDYIGEFPSKDLRRLFRTRKKFERLISAFKPDVVLIDRLSKFGLEVIKSDIPLFLIGRGNWWVQNEWDKKTVYKNWLIQKMVEMRSKDDEQVFERATAIICCSNYLVDVVKEHYPKQNVHIFVEGIDSSNWYITRGMKLNQRMDALISYLLLYTNLNYLCPLQRYVHSV